MKKKKLLFKSGQDWTPELLDAAWKEIEIIAAEELRITYYKPQIEIVTARQMLDSYTSVGMPIYYKHWSFGKEFVISEKEYLKGRMGLAYELVINSDPCIAYLMEENNMMVQTLVMAHASVGHSAVFKHNYLFKAWTDAQGIIDYLAFAKNYLKKCEEKYGSDEVEAVLDACHALQNYGIDRYKKPKKLSAAQEEAKAMERFDRELADYDHVWETVGRNMASKVSGGGVPDVVRDAYVKEPQENILYFIEKNAPALPVWKREVIRIVRKLAEYFSPQRQTKTLNEGYATFAHYYIMNRLYDKGLLDGGTMLDFHAIHTNVVAQRDQSHFNPYKLGFEIFMDIKRICQNPTDEDKKYFPDLAGSDWVEAVNYAMMNFKDETFIMQYLSPKLARDFRMFALNDPHLYADAYEITDISNESGFYALREKLAYQHNNDRYIPDIQVVHVDAKGSRRLGLQHFPRNSRPIDIPAAKHVISHAATLWEYSVFLRTIEYGDDSADPHEVVITAPGKYSDRVDESAWRNAVAAGLGTS